jgi:hypothetical protein
MMKSQWLGFLAILFSLTACAPVSYEATYRPPPGHVSTYIPHKGVDLSRAYRSPIQVTLYSDSTYLGVNFQPIQIVVSDNEYVEIPVRNRRGRPSRIYAHYHLGALHFDANRKCQKIPGSTVYQHSNHWDKGYRYSHVSAGHDYDLTGLRLVIRNAPQVKRHTNQVKPYKKSIVHNKTKLFDKYQSVTQDKNSPEYTKVVVHKNNSKSKNNVAVKANSPKRQTQSVRDKLTGAGNELRAIDSRKPKSQFKPEIVREVNKRNKTSKGIVATHKQAGTNRLNRTDVKHSSNGKGQQVAHTPKSVKLESHRKPEKPYKYKTSKETHAKERAPDLEKRKEAQSNKKKARRASSNNQKNTGMEDQQGRQDASENNSDKREKRAQARND